MQGDIKVLMAIEMQEEFKSQVIDAVGQIKNGTVKMVVLKGEPITPTIKRSHHKKTRKARTKNPNSHKGAWTIVDDINLKTLCKKYKKSDLSMMQKYKIIAKKLGRTWLSVKGRVSNKGIVLK